MFSLTASISMASSFSEKCFVFQSILTFSFSLPSRILGATGFMNYIDENGDCRGNFTLLGKKCIGEWPNQTCGMYPIGMFQLSDNSSNVPVSGATIHSVVQFTFSLIAWVGGCRCFSARCRFFFLIPHHSQGITPQFCWIFFLQWFTNMKDSFSRSRTWMASQNSQSRICHTLLSNETNFCP